MKILSHCTSFSWAGNRAFCRDSKDTAIYTNGAIRVRLPYRQAQTYLQSRTKQMDYFIMKVWNVKMIYSGAQANWDSNDIGLVPVATVRVVQVS
jgi:hypothetical protein